MAVIIDGKALSVKLKNNMKAKVEELKESGINPCLAVIIVGDNPASRVYVNNKKKSCEELGIKSLESALPAETTEEELLELYELIDELEGL